MAGANVDQINSGNDVTGGGDAAVVVRDGNGNGGALQHAGRGAQVANESAALISMIERAARDPSVDIDKMERLFGMQQRAVERHAKTAFLAAFSKLQANLPAATRGGKGHNDKKYARFEDVITAVRPHLAAHGFSLSFRVVNENAMMRVVGVLGHADGHSEQTDIVLPADTTGNKNAVQALGSSVSYGKRYVALTLLGIATEDDDDGKAGGAVATITEDQAEKIKAALDETGGQLPRFCVYWKLEKLTDLSVDKFDEAMASIISAKRRTK